MLEYQEERLLDSEDQEVQMALYINILARSVLALNLTYRKGSRSSGAAASLGRRAPGDDDAQRRRVAGHRGTPATGAYRGSRWRSGGKEATRPRRRADPRHRLFRAP